MDVARSDQILADVKQTTLETLTAWANDTVHTLSKEATDRYAREIRQIVTEALV
jgi:hypothetical protein